MPAPRTDTSSGPLSPGSRPRSGHLRRPPPLRPGDRVAVVAPASPFPPADVESGLAWLRERYRVEVGAHVHGRRGYLAGTDQERAADLQRALDDEETRAIFCVRGGYGILRLLDALTWSGFTASPKWICGFSDVTALHAAASDAGVASLHAHNLTGLGRGSSHDRAQVLSILESETPTLHWPALVPVHGAGGATARGRLFGGNVALLHALAAAGRLRVPEGAIVLLEDVGERPYRLDRMMVGLRLGGHLAGAAGIVLGEFRDCGPGADGVSAVDVLAAETSLLGIPVWQDAPFGHGATNEPFPLGMEAELAGGALRIGA